MAVVIGVGMAKNPEIIKKRYLKQEESNNNKDWIEFWFHILSSMGYNAYDPYRTKIKEL